MPHKQYVYCSCESHGCKNNPDGSGQKLQEGQTAAQHERADTILIAECLVAAAQQVEADKPPTDDHPQSGANSLDSEPPDYPDLAELFDNDNEQPHLVLDPDPEAFSLDPDEDIFDCLGRVHIKEELDGGDSDGHEELANAKGNNDKQAGEDEDQLNTILFVSQGPDFDFSDAHETADIHSTPPLCMEDHPAVRNAYIHAFVGAAYYNATHAAVEHDLSGKECLLHVAQQANPDADYPGLDNFAQTLLTLL
ncbi:hypothetical protein PAXRUDRAFT_163081 [Paxillus rubicundulus Ve08.2h10]|uniref:Uncharacterized protein n=1 Tax=Paxillus rubicundulus Ve08.2h10 TaxID=930991 RepID=A0A0D0DKK6_9AGAM|nr:hypothetical protein PAXRUDRAFT_163081 [Paxillus rubicundulus Ve08.2h10]